VQDGCLPEGIILTQGEIIFVGHSQKSYREILLGRKIYRQAGSAILEWSQD
jgi:hypothetical protein